MEKKIFLGPWDPNIIQFKFVIVKEKLLKLLLNYV
jgi:hypothetical protein